MNTTNIINYNNILEGSGLGDIAHLIHGGMLVLVACVVVVGVFILSYKVLKGDF